MVDLIFCNSCIYFSEEYQESKHLKYLFCNNIRLHFDWIINLYKDENRFHRCIRYFSKYDNNNNN